MKVAVIGGGIAGASAAYHLSQKSAEVVLIDDAKKGEATTAGAGIISSWSSRVENQDWQTLVSESTKFYDTLIPELKAEGQTDIGYREVGAMSISRDPKELDDLERRAKQRANEYPEIGKITRLSAAETKSLFPPLAEDIEGVHLSGAARVNGIKLRDALRYVAEQKNTIVKKGEATLHVKGGKVVGVVIDDETIEADAVIVAAGAWSQKLLEPLGIDLSIKPQRGQIVHLKLPGVDTTEWPSILPHEEGGHVLLSFDDSRVVIGVTRESGVGYDYRTTAGGIELILREALKTAPGLSDSTFYESRVGFRPIGPDILPSIGTVSNVPGLVIASGLGAMGLNMGPYVGKLAASLSLDEKPEMDISAFNPIR